MGALDILIDKEKHIPICSFCKKRSDLSRDDGGMYFLAWKHISLTETAPFSNTTVCSELCGYNYEEKIKKMFPNEEKYFTNGGGHYLYK